MGRTYKTVPVEFDAAQVATLPGSMFENGQLVDCANGRPTEVALSQFARTGMQPGIEVLRMASAPAQFADATGLVADFTWLEGGVVFLPSAPPFQFSDCPGGNLTIEMPSRRCGSAIIGRYPRTAFAKAACSP